MHWVRRKPSQHVTGLRPSQKANLPRPFAAVAAAAPAVDAMVVVVVASTISYGKESSGCNGGVGGKWFMACSTCSGEQLRNPMMYVRVAARLDTNLPVLILTFDF